MAHFKNIEQIFQITDKCILNQSGLCSHKENSRQSRDSHRGLLGEKPYATSVPCSPCFDLVYIWFLEHIIENFQIII